MSAPSLQAAPARTSVATALAALARAPGLSDALNGQVEVAALAGLTNETFRVDTHAGSFAVQLPRPGDAVDAARRHAIAATRLADALGVGASVVHAEEEGGAIVTRWVAGARPADAAALRAAPMGLAAVSACFARLHASAARLQRRFDPFAAIAGLTARLGADGLSPRLATALARAEPELARGLSVAVPIHGDPVPENVLVAADGVVLIDWDFAGMGDPAWDLAYFALEAGLTRPEEEELAAAYGLPGVETRRRMLNRMTAAALVALWGADRMRAAPAPDLRSWIVARRAEAEAIATTLYAGPRVG